MKSSLFTCFVCLFAFVLSSSEAKMSGSILRGGLGYLYPDHNNFNDPGQLALDHGTGIEVLWETNQGGNQTQKALPSLVYSNGKIAVGFYGSRVGQSLTNYGSYNALDTIGAMGAFSWMDMVTVGVGYSQNISAGAPAANTLLASVNINSKGGKGVSIGAVASKNLSPQTATLSSNPYNFTVGVGYAFLHNNAIEFDINLNSNNQYTPEVNFVFGGMSSYVGLKVKYLYQQGNNYEAEGRLGIIVREAFDISALASYTFTQGSTLTYGATLRLAL